MDILGIQWDRNRIEIVDFGGTYRDLSLLARYAVEPMLGQVARARGVQRQGRPELPGDYHQVTESDARRAIDNARALVDEITRP
jgi:hypothetical protein